MHILSEKAINESNDFSLYNAYQIVDYFVNL
jgi:hypothetical protein